MRTSSQTRVIAMVVGAALVGFLLGGIRGPVQAANQDILQKVLTTHVLTIGTIGGNPPWEFTQPNGELNGYDIAIGKMIAKDLGAKADFVQTSEGGRIPILQTHKADIVLAELNYSPERARSVAYTTLYAVPENQFMVLANSPYHTVEDLNKSSVRLGYALGGIEAKIWPALLPNAKLQAFTTVADTLQALLSHRIDATGEPSILNGTQMKAHPGQLRVINPPYLRGRVAIGLPYGDFDWWLWLNQWVEWFNGSGANQQVWKQYVGVGSPFGT